MRETLNRYFGYPGKEFWSMDSSKSIPVTPLVELISSVNMENNWIAARPESERLNKGTYFAKSFLYVYDEVFADLKAKGMTLHTMGLGETSYITICPEEHKKSPLRYNDDIDTLIVMASTDYSDPNYGMYTMEKYRDYVEMAAKERMIVHFCMYNKLDTAGRLFYSVRESLVIHRFNYRRLYLDVSSLLAAGKKVSDAGVTIPGFENPDDAVEKLGSLNIPVVNIKDVWQSEKLSMSLKGGGGNHNMDFNLEHYVSSARGRMKADAALFYEGINDPADPELDRRMKAIGLQMDVRESMGERWITFTPLQALEEEKKLPIVCGFYEMYAYSPAGAIDQMRVAHSFIDMAAQGEFILLLFAQEDLDDNDMLADLIYEAAEKLPVDLSRVYITGHSHNGRFTAEFTRRHQKLVAAAAPLGNEPGQLSPEWTSGFFAITDEQLDKQASVDTPICMLNGYNETNCMYPLYTDAPYPNPRTPFIALNKKYKRVQSWQRRLRSMNCPIKTEEEICATEFSENYVERKLGIPADRTEVLYLNGSEIYIADMKNNNGDYHFRVCAFGNCPHETTPDYAQLMWNFCRRFARDQETGETIELYSYYK